jgi:superfamily I DNA/RNA helicase
MGAATDYSPQFLRGEWEQIILGQGIEARDAYFKAKRAGRGVSLNRRARAEVWGIAEQVKHMLAERGQRSWLQIAGDAAGYMANRAVKPYLHVVVDEAQDLHQNQWRLLRAAVPDHDNDLFLVGDAHQRIYRAPAPLSKVGVHIVGRSRKLRLNYRTTHEILGWSLAALGEGDFDDLDDSTDNHDDGDYHSLLRGPAPELLGSPTRKDHYDELVAQVQQWIAKGLDPTEIGVAGRVADSVRSAMNAVSDAGHETELLTGEFKPKDGVKFGTMHRMKGLEFRALAIVDASSDRIPLATFLTPAHEDQRQHDADLQRERCLLYVAASRAREHLWVGWSGQPSRFLPSDAAE